MREALPWPLMRNNIRREDLDQLIAFLQREEVVLTQSKEVRAFEEEWSNWLGVKHSVFVNSGASANLLTMAALKHLYGEGEVIVPTLTWVSDIASVLQNNLHPVFVDIDRHTLGMSTKEVLRKITTRTKAVFLTHVLGLNALDLALLEACRERGILLIEDVCESHGARFQGKKLGTFGLASNFSFYYAHHMSTIEGGMVCTDNEDFYETVRMLRSHGMVREMDSAARKSALARENEGCHPDFIFSYPAYNVRSTELNAVLGRSQLKRLDEQNERRTRNFSLFLENLDPKKYRRDFSTEGSVNYAFILVLREPNEAFCERLMQAMREAGIEHRRGLSGGGNQLRQPYLKPFVPAGYHGEFPEVEYVHRYGFYLGNYPDLEREEILRLCRFLNGVD